jgi:hypothetical protein
VRSEYSRSHPIDILAISIFLLDPMSALTSFVTASTFEHMSIADSLNP